MNLFQPTKRQISVVVLALVVSELAAFLWLVGWLPGPAVRPSDRPTLSLLLFVLFFVTGLPYTIYLGVSRGRANWQQLTQVKDRRDSTDRGDKKKPADSELLDSKSRR